MPETYLQLAQQIEELQHRAATVKEQEMAEVIERIRLAIKAYGLTVEQLFGMARARFGDSRAPAKKSGRKSSSGAKFQDASGNVWSGRGPRPGWIKAALAAGRSMNEFAVAGVDAAAPRGRSVKATPVAKYKDDAGHSWSGRGPKPRWFKAALEAGRTPDELAV